MRKTIVILLSCTIVLLLGYSAYRSYELWKQSHWMSLARQFAAAKDGHNEFLCLEQVLLRNPRNIEAARMMADLAQAAGSSSALTWRKKVLDLDPSSLDDRLALAQTAFLVHDYATAASALDGVDAEGRKTAAYLSIAGEMALAANKSAEAQADFTESVRLDPSNPGPQLSLASIELAGTNPLDQAEGRLILQRLSTDSTNIEARLEAKRELTLDALRFKDSSTALSLSKELTDRPDAPFSDKILRLYILKTTQNEQYQPMLASYETQAAEDPQNLSKLALWLMQQRSPGQALSWLQGLPGNVRTNMPAALLAAQCQMLLQDWSGLQKSVSKENWGRLDFTRQAYLARALQQQGLDEASKAQWTTAVSSANGQDGNLIELYRLALAWNWQDDAQEILWTIVNNFPQEKWAQDQLAVQLYAAGGTRPLLKLFSLEVGRNPSDLNAKNDLALAAMLLHEQEMNPYQLAYEAYSADSTNSYYICVYAYSLYLQGKNAEALKIMQQLSPEQLNNNSTAGYYGLILKATGNDAQAQTYLKRAVRGQVLPEERALFQQAMSGS
jgi:hypothetical protein